MHISLWKPHSQNCSCNNIIIIKILIIKMNNPETCMFGQPEAILHYTSNTFAILQKEKLAKLKSSNCFQLGTWHWINMTLITIYFWLVLLLANWIIRGSTSLEGQRDGREFGHLTDANPSELSSFQETRFAAGAEAVIRWNKRLLQKAEQDLTVPAMPVIYILLMSH